VSEGQQAGRGDGESQANRGRPMVEEEEAESGRAEEKEPRAAA